MKFETWLLKRMAEILESDEWEIKYMKNLKIDGETVWGRLDEENLIIYIELLDEKPTKKNQIEKSPAKSLILFHEILHIIFGDYFESGGGDEAADNIKTNFNSILKIFRSKIGEKKSAAIPETAMMYDLEESFVLTLELLYFKLAKKQKEYLESFLPQNQGKTKKPPPSRKASEDAAKNPVNKS